MDPNTQQPVQEQQVPPLTQPVVLPPQNEKSGIGTLLTVFFATMFILGLTGAGAFYILSQQKPSSPYSSTVSQVTVTPTAGASAAIVATSDSVDPESVPTIVEIEQLNEDLAELDQLLSTL